MSWRKRTSIINRGGIDPGERGGRFGKLGRSRGRRNCSWVALYERR